MIRSLFSLVALLSASSAFAEDWPGWRGPRRDGTTDSSKYPTEWSGTKNVQWKTEIPGVGHSSPVVSKGKIFLTTCLETDAAAEKPRQLLCIDRATGKIEWTRTLVASPMEKKHKLNSYASSTPVVDGERIYVTFYDQPSMRVYCYDYTGKKLWDVAPGEFHSVHGFCSSPVLYKDLLIVNADQDPKKDGKAYIVALDKNTGKEKYRIDRPNRLRSYCPPVLIDVDGKPQMVMTGSKCVDAYDPETGKQIWIVKGPTEQFVASIVYLDGTIFLTAGFPQRWVMAINPRGTGDVSKSHTLWAHMKDGAYVPSPVAVNGKGYVVTDEGIASCWDLKTGDQLWKERLGAHQTGSGIVANGKVYFTDDNGLTYIFATGKEFEVLHKNPLGEKCYSSPAFTDGQIFIRGEKHLFCIEEKK